MLVFNKTAIHYQKPNISPPISKEKRLLRKKRLNTKKIINLNNKKFLRALGFKL